MIEGTTDDGGTGTGVASDALTGDGLTGDGVTGDGSAPDGLPAILRAAARNAPTGAMIAEVAVGVAGIAAVLWFRPPLTPAALAGATVLLAFGCWGIADRELERGELGRVTGSIFSGARALSALFGWLALLVIAFSIAGIAIGYWKL